MDDELTEQTTYKKKDVPAADWLRKSEAKVPIQLKILYPAPDLRTNNAMACCATSPTMTVGQGISARLDEVRKNPTWKTTSPSTEIALSPYEEPWGMLA